MYRNWYRKLGGRKGVISLGRSVGFKGSAISASGAQFRWSNRQLAFLETFQRLFSFWGEDKKKGKGERERRCKVDIPDFGNDSTWLFFFEWFDGRERKREKILFSPISATHRINFFPLLPLISFEETIGATQTIGPPIDSSNP